MSIFLIDNAWGTVPEKRWSEFIKPFEKGEYFTFVIGGSEGWKKEMENYEYQ